MINNKERYVERDFISSRLKEEHETLRKYFNPAGAHVTTTFMHHQPVAVLVIRFSCTAKTRRRRNRADQNQNQFTLRTACCKKRSNNSLMSRRKLLQRFSSIDSHSNKTQNVYDVKAKGENIKRKIQSWFDDSLSCANMHQLADCRVSSSLLITERFITLNNK